MMHPELAAEVRRALIAWQHLQARNGQPLADGFGGYVEVVSAAARAGRPDPGPDWLTLEEAAERARCSVSTIYRWRTAGLPSRRVGGRVLIARVELDRWLRSSVGQSSVRTVHEAA